MSDTYLRLIPADRTWQPTTAAADAAAAFVTRVFTAGDAEVERVAAEFYDRVTLIDAGMYTERITCPRCAADISLDWWGGVVVANGGPSFDDLAVTVPCCGYATELDRLRYDAPVGYARFEVTALNAVRTPDELDAGELAEVARLLGHPVVQIVAHY